MNGASDSPSPAPPLQLGLATASGKHALPQHRLHRHQRQDCQVEAPRHQNTRNEPPARAQAPSGITIMAEEV